MIPTKQDIERTWEVSFTGDYMTLTTTITNANNHEQAIIIAKELILDYYGIDTFALGLTDILTETL